MTIQLGDKAKCTVTGFEGICTSRTEYISGCARVGLQPAVGKDGKLPDAMSFDEPMCKVTKKAAVKAQQSDNGGPRPEPFQHATPSR